MRLIFTFASSCCTHRELLADRDAREVISYCSVGEGSSHAWLVLEYLLGFRYVKNYDGSWTE
jgi:3-mercaptopyruvate sulfurtransferase SseA